MAQFPQRGSPPGSNVPITPPPGGKRAVELRYAQATRAAAEEAAAFAQASDALVEKLLREPLARRLEALDGKELSATDRRRVRESVGVGLVPPRQPVPALRRRGWTDRLRVALARWRLNPFAVVIALLAAAPVVVGVALAWIHTGRGVRASGACHDIVFTRPDGTDLRVPLDHGDLVIVRGYDGPGVEIALWAPLTGYVTALVYPRCLTDRR